MEDGFLKSLFSVRGQALELFLAAVRGEGLEASAFARWGFRFF
jgi:hypothetical protein